MEPPLWNLASYADPRPPSALRLTRDVFVVVVVAAVLVSVGRVPAVWHVVSPEQVSMVLALAATAASVAAAVLAGVVYRLASDARSWWVSGAFGLYGLVAIPTTTIEASVESGQALTGAARLTANALVILMILTAAWPAACRARVGELRLFTVNSATVAVATAAACVYPEQAQALSSYGLLRWGMAIAWLIGGVMIVIRALSVGLTPSFRIGLGLVLISLAHAYRIDSEPAQPLALPGLVFSALRLAGVLVVLIGTADLAWRVLRRLEESQWERQRQLRLAEIGAARLAERDHELRNGLAGLAGAASLLRGSLGEAEQAELRAVVAAELRRLDQLLRCGHRDTVDEPETCACDVSRVLRDLAILRRRSGLDIWCEVESGLHALSSPAVLTQTLTNLLANCERHAPASPVRVRAARCGDRVVVQVTDFGPGIPAGAEEAIFERGTRGVNSPGRGLGLHICRELLAKRGGTIRVRPGSPGCTIEVELLAAGPASVCSGAGPLLDH